jgi:hypothetical protein
VQIPEIYRKISSFFVRFSIKSYFPPYVSLKSDIIEFHNFLCEFIISVCCRTNRIQFLNKLFKSRYSLKNCLPDAEQSKFFSTKLTFVHSTIFNCVQFIYSILFQATKIIVVRTVSTEKRENCPANTFVHYKRFGLCAEITLC